VGSGPCDAALPAKSLFSEVGREIGNGPLDVIEGFIKESNGPRHDDLRS
jgi:hypothetical protein